MMDRWVLENQNLLNEIIKNIDESPYFYFVHSFYVKPNSDDLVSSYSEYNDFRFCSSVRKDNIFACQFHPEKSGTDGLILLENFFKKEYFR